MSQIRSLPARLKTRHGRYGGGGDRGAPGAFASLLFRKFRYRNSGTESFSVAAAATVAVVEVVAFTSAARTHTAVCCLRMRVRRWLAVCSQPAALVAANARALLCAVPLVREIFYSKKSFHELPSQVSTSHGIRKIRCPGFQLPDGESLGVGRPPLEFDKSDGGFPTPHMLHIIGVGGNILSDPR